MPVKYTYIDYLDHKILLREFTKDSNFEEIFISFKEILDKNMLTNETLGLITDIRNVKFQINPPMFRRASKFIKDNPELYKFRYAALTNSPMQVVLIIAGSMSTPQMRVKPFSTYKGCVKWIAKDISV